MKRIPTSEKMRKELETLLKGVDSKEFLLSEILRKGAAIILQELLEQEVTEFLGKWIRNEQFSKLFCPLMPLVNNL